MEEVQGRRGRRVQHSRKPTLVICIILALLLAGYLAFCAAATASRTIYPNYTVHGVNVGRQDVAAATDTLAEKLPQTKLDVFLSGEKDQPAATATYEELGFSKREYFADLAQAAYDDCHSGWFLTNGAHYLQSLLGKKDTSVPMDVDDAALETAAATLQQKLAVAKQDASFQLLTDKGTLEITKGQDGREVDKDAIVAQLKEVLSSSNASSITVDAQAVSAKEFTAQEISDQSSAEMKNAGYDSATGKITPEQVGAKFDVSAAQKLLDDAKPGETISVTADIEEPAVTAEELKSVLFRDVLGTATTHVGGSSARISNVKLASRSVNGTVLNSGDVFSYNGTVGQRTAAKGYQAAPAYVQGETVDEIGGGVCQPSSTLYLACLRSNLAIVQRAAHRYAPSYIEWGMDATVSWGGPDYQFKNNTNYPVKIMATYSGGYLTMKLVGTKTDGSYVKMSKKVLSTTAYKVIHQEDPTLPAGTHKTKVTPYTGYKVQSFRSVYSSDGTLISSKLEDTSNYKVRDEIILDGTKAASGSTSGTTSGTTSGSTSETGGKTETGTGTKPETGTDTGASGETPAAPTTPDTTGDEGYGA